MGSLRATREAILLMGALMGTATGCERQVVIGQIHDAAAGAPADATMDVNGDSGPCMLAGDYNRDGVVDNADYDLLALTFGSTTDLRADGNGNGTVDLADYTIWRDNLGRTCPDV